MAKSPSKTRDGALAALLWSACLLVSLVAPAVAMLGSAPSQSMSAAQPIGVLFNPLISEGELRRRVAAAGGVVLATSPLPGVALALDLTRPRGPSPVSSAFDATRPPLALSARLRREGALLMFNGTAAALLCGAPRAAGSASAFQRTI